MSPCFSRSESGRWLASSTAAATVALKTVYGQNALVAELLAK